MSRRKILFLPKVFNHLAYKGIIDYAREAGWQMELRYVFYRNFPQCWKGDGIISNHADDPEITRFIKESGVPSVDIGMKTELLKSPKVWFDNAAIGEMAGRYFLEKGFKHFACFDCFPGFERVIWNFLRYSGFRDSVEVEGNTFLDITENVLIRQLQDAPKPLAILAGNDMVALRLLDGCEEAGVRVPEEVAVVGIDNNPDYCDLASIPLSSVDSNCYGVGQTACQLLDSLIDGATPPTEPVLVPPISVATRQSTDILAVPHLPTAKAVRYIAENYDDAQLDLSAAAKHAGISRRNLEAAFKRHLGYSMFERVERLRLERAMELIKKSDCRGHEIAAICGFSNTDHLSRVLKKHFGKSLRQLRKG